MTAKEETRMNEIVNWANEFKLPVYDTVYELVFDFYETAGFWPNELEKELQTKSEVELMELYSSF